MTAFDQTALFWDISLNVAKQQGLDEARIRKLRSAQILRSLAKSSFTLAAIELAAAVSQVTQLMQSQRQDYVQPGRMSQAQQDAVEHEMARGLKVCKENIQQLQSQIQKSSSNAGQLTINTATAAHRS